VKYGVVLFTSDRGITPAEVAQVAEHLGFDSVAVPEHTHIPVRREAAHPGTESSELPDDRYTRTLDPWVSLAMAAAVTSRIRLSTAVALPAEHDPISLAKTIASLDHLSGGRVDLGIGFGWNTDELTDHGVPGARRRTVLLEHVAAMRALWTQDEAEYAGELVSFGPSWAWPKPVQQPLPVLLGAGGTERNFRWIAAHADGWISTPRDTEIERRVAELQWAWVEAGRAGLPRVSALAGRPDLEELVRWQKAGVTEVLFGLPDRSAAEVAGYLGKLAGRIGLTGES
jgi:probable F420-dependent oxidoreductase